MLNDLTPVILVKNDEYWLIYCLESIRNRFKRIVIYDIGSTDRTKDIIEWFITSSPDTEFYTRFLPHCEPEIQGIFRNSMIAEALSDYYLILDADEIWTQEALNTLEFEFNSFKESKKRYGIVPRIEIAHDLKKAHGLSEYVIHHRLYHRSAIWKGTHPGEQVVFKQIPKTEYRFSFNTKIYHFHQPDRSSKDNEVPSRLARRFKQTYLRGDTHEIDLLEILPMLRKPINNFPVNPLLKELQEKYASKEMY